MAQGTRTWQSLVGLASARCGCPLGGDESTQIGFLLNSAAHQLYNENPWWERFLVLEPRTVERGYIAYTEDSYNVYGAGTSEANGLYVRNGSSVDGKPAYTLYNADGVTAKYNLWSANGVTWFITSSAIDSVTAIAYFCNSSSATPPAIGWVVQSGGGESPTPIVQLLSEIGEYIGHWDGAKWSGANPNMGTAYPDQNGIRVATGAQDGTVYVAFKKSFTTTYGDGTNGTTSDVPSEWFEFMAYSAARSFIQSQRQSDSYQPIAISEIERVREQALLKISRQGIYKTIAQRFRTYYNADVSIY